METKLIERMKRLLAMSKDAGSENEAMIAARRLHSLLSQHGMSMSDLNDTSEEVSSDLWEETNRPYARTIAAAIAKLYYCEMYYMKVPRSKTASFVFCGKEHHRAIAIQIAQMVIRVIARESITESRKRFGTKDTHFVNSFRNGAAGRIANRCLDLIKEAKAGTLVDADTGNTLPALASLYDSESAAVKAFFDTLSGMKAGKTRANMARGAEGVSAGRAAGDRVQLHQGLSKTAPKLLG